MPAEFVLPTEAATGVSRHYLRPDIYPVDLPPAPAQGARSCGIDKRAGSRTTGVDARAKRAHFNRKGISQGAAA